MKRYSEIFRISVLLLIFLTLNEVAKISQMMLSNFSPKHKDKELKFKQEMKKFWIDDYMKKHRSIKDIGNERILIFRLPNGGLGDMYGGLISAFYFARFTDRVLLIEKPKKFDLRLIFSEQAMREFVRSDVTDNLNITERFHPEKDLIGGFAKRALEGCMKPQRFVLMSSWYKFSVVDLFSLAGASGISLATKLPPNQNLVDKEIEINRLIIRELFPMPPSIIQKFQYHSKKMSLQQGNYVSIHARIGMGTNESWEGRFKYASNNMDKVADCFANLSTQNTTLKKIYVASDTPEFNSLLRIAVGRIKRDVTVVSAPWGNTGHVRRQSKTHFQERTNIENTMVELLLLSNAKEFWHLSSGFALLARRLGIPKRSMNVFPQDCTSSSTDQRSRL